MDMHSIWRENWPKGIPTASPLPYGKMPIADYLKKQAEIWHQKVAINYYGREITFGEWDELADRLATAIADLGHRKGDKIVLILPTSPQFLIAYIAAARLGLISMPIDITFKEFEIEYALKDFGDPNIIIVSDELYAVIKPLRERNQIKQVIVTSLCDYLPIEPTLPLHKTMTMKKKTFPDTLDFLDLIGKYTPAPPQVNIGIDELEMILHTGGTTGFPKGCPHSHEDILRAGVHDAYLRGIGSDMKPVESVLCFLPLSHVAGLCASIFSFAIGSLIILSPRATYASIVAIGAVFILLQASNSSI